MSLLVFTTSARNNGISTAYRGMPFKSLNMTQGSALSNSRAAYENEKNIDIVNKRQFISSNLDSSDYVRRRKVKAIGKNAYKVGIAQDAPVAFKSSDATIRNSRLAKCRAGGCTAPKKKSSVSNTFKSGGSSIMNSAKN